MNESEAAASFPELQIHIQMPRRVSLGESFSIGLEVENRSFAHSSDQGVAVYVKPTAYHISDRAKFFSRIPEKENARLEFNLQATHSGLELIEIELFLGAVRLAGRSIELQAVPTKGDTQISVDRPDGQRSSQVHS